MSDLLKRAREKIAKPENWCQRAFAKDADGGICQTQSPIATCWCAIGALLAVRGDSYRGLALIRLTKAANILGYAYASVLNDKTDHETVLKMYDIAMEE